MLPPSSEHATRAWYCSRGQPSRAGCLSERPDETAVTLMPSQIFRTKTLDAILSDGDTAAASTQPSADGIRCRDARDRGDRGRRNLRHDRHGGRRGSRRVPVQVLHWSCRSPSLGWHVDSLRSAMPSSPRWYPISGSAYTYAMRHARRTRRMDYRLGFDYRVRSRQRRSRYQLGKLLQDPGLRVRRDDSGLAVDRLSAPRYGFPDFSTTHRICSVYRSSSTFLP